MFFEKWELPQEVEEKFLQILDIVLDNNDESRNDLDIRGSDIDNISSDSEFEYEYEPLPQRKPPTS